nr:uncharacterized protein LOC128693583 isoform X2 [Cherax quadricarinatus]
MGNSEEMKKKAVKRARVESCGGCIPGEGNDGDVLVKDGGDVLVKDAGDVLVKDGDVLVKDAGDVLVKDDDVLVKDEATHGGTSVGESVEAVVEAPWVGGSTREVEVGSTPPQATITDLTQHFQSIFDRTTFRSFKDHVMNVARVDIKEEPDSFDLDSPTPPSSPDINSLLNCSAVFQEHDNTNESDRTHTIQDPDRSFSAQEETIKFIIVPEASQRGRDLLVEGSYTYVKDRASKKGRQRWRCQIRRGRTGCLASVMQEGDKFTRGSKPHTCDPRGCTLALAKIKAYVRREGKARPSASGSTIANEAVAAHLSLDIPATCLPSMDSLIRSVNFLRQNRGPQHPKDLQFEWVYEALPPNFVRQEVKLGHQRHIIMYTDKQLQLLQKAKILYSDVTFKVIQIPYKQLWCIHVFIMQDNLWKQIPVLMVLMSRRFKSDYVAVLSKMRELVPSFRLRTVVLDFESAVWAAFNEVFRDENIVLRGCAFHWTQAIYRRIKKLGLQLEYNQKKKTQTFLQELMCLPYLPADQIEEVFLNFYDLVEKIHPKSFRRLMSYIEKTWISGCWCPTDWSVFKHSIRTNDDVKEWHDSLNTAESIHTGKVNMYKLIEVLYRESKKVPTQCQLMSEQMIQNRQRKAHISKQIYQAWEELAQRKITQWTLLGLVAKYHQPSLIAEDRPDSDEE